MSARDATIIPAYSTAILEAIRSAFYGSNHATIGTTHLRTIELSHGTTNFEANTRTFKPTE
jgi:hypothetical protein